MRQEDINEVISRNASQEAKIQCETRVHATSHHVDMLKLMEMVNSWEKKADYFNHHDDHPEDRAAGSVYRECAGLLRDALSGKHS